MWTMKCAVVCALAGMVCTVAAASGEAYNGGFGGELAHGAQAGLTRRHRGREESWGWADAGRELRRMMHRMLPVG